MLTTAETNTALTTKGHWRHSGRLTKQKSPLLKRFSSGRFSSSIYAVDGFNVDTPEQIITEAIDTGSSVVDLSSLNLTRVPDEIAQLKYHTCVHQKSIITAGLQLYMYNNSLTRLPSFIFELNLNCLSLRENLLEYLPSVIGRLKNLRELSVSGNMLEYFPIELTRLNLTVFNFSGNPLMKDPQRGFIGSNGNTVVNTLQELSLKSLSLTARSTETLPARLNQQLMEEEEKWCINCGTRVFVQYYYSVNISEFMGSSLPFKSVYCLHCANHH
jgi:hypothetical protein